MMELAEQIARDPRRMRSARKLREQGNDHRAFAKHLHVRAKSGELIPYILQPSQLKLLAAVEEQQRQGRPVRIISLKARQVMMSTAVAGIFYQQLGFNTGIHARVVAHESDAAGDIFDYYRTFHDNYDPTEGFRKAALVNDAQGWMRWDNDSWARILAARNTGSGRSATVSLYHLSEFGFWNDATKLMRGVLGSVPKTPESMVIVESTANGMGNEFHRLCLLAMDPRRRSAWKFVFFAWHEHPEYQMELDCAVGEFDRDLSAEERALQRRFRLSLEQLRWRRWMIEDEFSGDEEGFKQEYPSTPQEAFIQSGRPYFSTKHVARAPVVEPALIGDLCQERIGTMLETYVLPNDDGALRIWKQPEQGHIYTLGADTAKGLDVNEGVGQADPDWSVGCVLDYRSGEQVAVYRARVIATEFGRILEALARWYGTTFVVPEGDGLGRSAIEEMLRRHYPAGLIWAAKPDLLSKGNATTFQLGYQPTQVNRVRLLARLQLAVIDMSVLVRDAETQSEMQTFIYKPDGKPEHQSTCHDDCVFALAYALTGIQDFPVSYLKSANSERIDPEDEPPTRLKRYGRPLPSRRGRR